MPDRRDNPFSTRSAQSNDSTRKPTTSYLEPDDLDDDGYQASEHQVFGLGIPQADERQPTYGQGVVISLLSAAALLLLAIIAIGDGDNTDPPVLHRAGTLYWAIAGVALVATALGAHYAERVAVRNAEDSDSPRLHSGISTAWVVPAVSVAAAIILTATFHNRWMLLVGPLIAFLGTSGALLSRDLLDEADADSIRVASTIHTVVVHAAAFLAFSAVYLNKFDTWLAAPAVAFIGGLLVLDTLERAGTMTVVRVGMALLGAWILAASMIALNWWPTWGWTGGAVLLAVFYIVSGLMQVCAENRPVRKRELVEFLGIGGIALLVLALRDVLL